MKSIPAILGTITLALVGAQASAADPEALCGTPQDYAWLDTALANDGEPGAVTATVRPTPAFGLCEATLQNGTTLYVNSVTRSVLVGTLYTVSNAGSLVDETAKAAQAHARNAIESVQQEDVISFAPQGSVRGHIYVMTDTDCGYCRKLHEEIELMTSQGIEVRYLPFVRGGKLGTSYETMSSVWCAADRKDALSNALKGTRFNQVACPQADAIDRAQALAPKVNLRGTPHILYPNGRTSSGYQPAAELVKNALANQVPAP